jgi:hypothetical protein
VDFGAALASTFVRCSRRENRLDRLIDPVQYSVMMTTLRLTATIVLGFAAALTAPQSPPANSTDAAADKTARVWDAATGKPLSSLPTHLGAWRLASFKYGESSNWSDAPTDQRRIKLITETHFTWVAYELASKKVLSMAGGPFTLNGETYTETIEFAGEGMTEYLGKKQSFKIRVEGDKLTQSGQLSDGTKLEEVWRRIK